MPSPASSPTKQHSQSRSQTVTRRSTVSAAFKNISTTPDVFGAQQQQQQQQNTGAEPSRGPMTSANIPISSANSKRVSVASVGTIVNPTATAAELLATKSPSVLFKQSASSSPPPPPAPAYSDTAAIVMGPSQAHPSPSQYSPSAIAQQLNAGQHSSSPPPQTSTSAPSQPSQGFVPSSQHQQRGGSSALLSEAPMVSTVGRGIVDVTFKKAAIFELVFSLLGFGIFLAFSIFMFTSAKCIFDEGYAVYIKAGAIAGLFASIFIMLHSCFERVALGRGIFGCFVFFLVTVVVLVNLGFGFIAMNCICSCVNGNNAFSTGSTVDQTIFMLALAGSVCLIAVLLISSVSHR